ncbi:hypothetical protein BS47DRAFT_1342062 [Hydnum rufescens UP504]|uniref:Uncharacterized protein n=1 Tax=Hydnum rufescens UP504 TaxID=1448309 RepID=A0A9P6DYW2_9AGAM|nr:hypothetical protein BS47DRAFT_1342062 [Hydnum rufescens UP504]
MPVPFLGKVASIFHSSEPQLSLPGSLCPHRKSVNDWCNGVLIAVEETASCSEFHLSKLWHWERSGLFRHEGLTFEFARNDSARVYIKVDRCSYDNDPYTSSVSLLNISGGATRTESLDQDSDNSLLRAKDWVHVLSREELAIYFRSSPANTRFKDVIKSLGTIDFTRGKSTVPPPPNLMDVMLVVKAVSRVRKEYRIWQANCWWLARSIRAFIESKWSRKADSPLPNITIARFDTGAERIIKDQPTIWGLYQQADAQRIEVMNRKSYIEDALRRAGDAERESREEREARLQAEVRVHEVEAKARAEREARIAAEEMARAAEEARGVAEDRIAKLEAQLRDAGGANNLSLPL